MRLSSARNHPSAERLLRRLAEDNAADRLRSQPSLSRKVVATRLTAVLPVACPLATIPQPKGCCDLSFRVFVTVQLTRNHPSAERLLRQSASLSKRTACRLATIPQPKGCCDLIVAAVASDKSARNHPSAERLLRLDGDNLIELFGLATIPQPKGCCDAVTLNKNPSSSLATIPQPKGCCDKPV